MYIERLMDTNISTVKINLRVEILRKIKKVGIDF